MSRSSPPRPESESRTRSSSKQALGRLGVDPARALFVGDRRYEDVRGAKEAGMTTVQAFWFRADDDERGLDPDFEAFTTMDVLNVVEAPQRRALSGRGLTPTSTPCQVLRDV